MPMPALIDMHSSSHPWRPTAALRCRPDRCVVCGAALAAAAPAGPLAPSLADPYPTCHAVACRMVVGRRAAMGETGFRHYLQRQARVTQELAARALASAARRVAETAENARAWAALHSFAGLPPASAPAPLRLVLPTGPRRARPLALVRRERYRAHLMAIAAEAAAMAPASVPQADAGTGAAAAAAGSTMPGQLCALCGGGCCTRGSDQAYLTAPTLRRFMDAQPQLSPAEVVAAYLERAAAAPMAGSCVNHTRAGCSLPRAMRSDTCNRFACAALARLLAAQRGEQPVQVVLVVRRAQDHWRRADPSLANGVNGTAVLRESGVRRMAPGRLPASATDP
jgi:hypothetical protein